MEIATIWGLYYTLDQNSIETIQRRATKLLTNFHDMCYSERLAKLGLPSLQYRRLRGDMIKTHDSESRGQEETAIIRETKNTRPLSELFTRKSVKKLTNALVKPP